MNGTAKTISVLDPLAPAFEWMKQILFRPFILEKWLAIGFCAWLATLGKSGGGGGGGVTNPKSLPGEPDNLRHAYQSAKNWIMENLHWLIPTVAAILALGILLWLLFTWLSSRGRFMFLHCVAGNRSEVRLPWTRYASHGDSLFFFRIFLGLVSFFAVVPLLVACAWLIVPMASAHRMEPVAVSALLLLGFLVVLAGLTFTVIAKFTSDFVVPIMYLHTPRCLDAWRELLPLLSANAGSVILYLLFQILLKLVIAMGVFLIVLLTCCIAGCLLAIPYVGTVLLLPVLVFERSYSLLYLAQFGTLYNVFAGMSNHTH